MANSIFPDSGSAGAVEIRDAAGVCLAPPEVHNVYCPPATFVATCALTALPSNCDARIEARQINAIVSELLSFAECLDPDGPWDCDSVRNLCDAFTVWAASNRATVDNVSIIGTGTAVDPFSVNLIDCGVW